MFVALVTGGSLADAYVRELEGLGYEVVNGSSAALARIGVSSDMERDLTEDELGEALSGTSIYIYGGLEPATRRALTLGTELKQIVFLGTGWADPGCVDADAAKDLGLRVSNTPHANARSTAEMTVALVLALERQIVPMELDMRRGVETPIRRRDVASLRFGIVGLGHVGSAVAKILAGGFGAVVNYASRSVKSDLERDFGIQKLSLPELFAVSDYISIHTPGSETIGLVGESLIDAMAASSALVNTATPGIVDGEALIGALESDQLFGVAMDGMYKESGLADRYYALGDRVIATPRAAWLTDDSYNRMGSMALESIEDAASGKTRVRYEVLSPSS